MAIYNLTGRADIWWQDVKRVKNIKEKYVTWMTFKKYFKRKFMSEQYYEEKAKEFYDLNLGSMTMKELCSKFLSLLRYVPYLVDEKPKVQRFLSCLSFAFKDRIEYDNPKTLEEAMRKANFGYEQSKNRRDNTPNWKTKRGGNSNFRERNSNYRKDYGNNSRNFSKPNFQNANSKRNSQQNPGLRKEMGQSTSYKNNNNNKDAAQKGPLKCWECGEPHYLRDCPVKIRNLAPNLHAVQRETTVGDLVRELPRISAALENRQEDHQNSMGAVEGMIKDKPISILIDPGASLSYVSPSIA